MICAEEDGPWNGWMQVIGKNKKIAGKSVIK
jgi:hypothetical protein